ncbi:helix-turn-helix domain-containing protein [Desmospora activa]|uniref:Excisionase family DNA binding protein n=1 Tax=Desmospora activa DSM 45169 TaxID=1121389 RepID=A0A2T4YZM2_9BACL|nr:helix-turn-helix domain-containing protein [Desmospora activa]PTM52707.1 excisionase family DNA binding protein [Desmospora activa DSM 45169]
MTGPVMNIEEAAKYLKSNPSTLYKMLRSGKIKGAKVGKEWRVHKDVLDDYLKGVPHNDQQEDE